MLASFATSGVTSSDATQTMTVAAENPAASASSLYYYDDLRIVHLELTHRCNAACPMYARTCGKEYDPLDHRRD